MINTKLIITTIMSLITIYLIYISHDKDKSAYLWVFAIVTTVLTLSIIVYDRTHEYNDEVNSKNTIAPLIRGIVEFNGMWFNMMAVDGGRPKAQMEDVSEKELTLILEKIDPHGNSPIVSVNEKNKQLIWTEFLLQLCLQTNNRIDEIYPHISNIDSELIKKLSETKNNYLLKDMLIQSNLNIGSKNLTYELKFIYDYFQKINSIKLYYDNNLKKYDNGELQNAWTPYLGK